MLAERQARMGRMGRHIRVARRKVAGAMEGEEAPAHRILPSDRAAAAFTEAEAEELRQALKMEATAFHNFRQQVVPPALLDPIIRRTQCLEAGQLVVVTVLRAR